MCAVNLLTEDTKCKDDVILIYFCLYGGEKCRVRASDRGISDKRQEMCAINFRPHPLHQRISILGASFARISKFFGYM